MPRAGHGEREESRPSIAFVIASLGPGGAERVVSSMANHWAERAWGVSVLTLSDPESDFFALSERVDRCALGLMHETRGPFRAIAANVRRVLAIRRALLDRRPGAVISFGDASNVLTLLAAIGTSLPVVVSERTDPRRLPLPGAWRALRRAVYPLARTLVVQTEGVAAWARRVTAPAKVRVIPNFVQRTPVSGAPDAGGDRRVVALGRFTREKGFDLLLDAFASCTRSDAAWSLVIAGDGPERDALRSRAERLGLRDHVRFPGVVRDVGGLLAASDVFVLPSRVEGFPNALLEAMAAGLPCIAFDCDSGPAEIIRDGEDGVLVPPEDTDSLARAIQRLMLDDRLRRRLGEAALAVEERFGVRSIMARWEALVEEVARA